MSSRGLRRALVAAAVLLAAGAGGLLWLREHRAAAQRTLLERALQSQSEGPVPVAPAEPEVPEGVPPEFWDSYYSDPGPPDDPG